MTGDKLMDKLNEIHLMVLITITTIKMPLQNNINKQISRLS